MSRFPLARLSSALPLLALLACKLGKDNEQTERALPTPEPAPSTAPPSRPVESEPPRDRPKEPSPRPTSEGTPASPKPATPTPTATGTATPTATATADAGTPAASDAGAPAAGADKLNQCIAKCQGSLSACLQKPVPLDAGVPSLESMSECKKAFEDCRTACTP